MCCVFVDVKLVGGLFVWLIEVNLGCVVVVMVDVMCCDDIVWIVVMVVECFGGVDILFNNVVLFDMCLFFDELWDVFDWLFLVNVKGLFFLM